MGLYVRGGGVKRMIAGVAGGGQRCKGYYYFLFIYRRWDILSGQIRCRSGGEGRELNRRI